MGEGAGHSSWQRAVDARLNRLQQQGGGLRQFALLWLAAVSAVMIACVVFFLVLYWMFG